MSNPEINPKGSRFGTILRNRKLLAAVGLLGGLFILKATGCLEGKSDGEPEVKKPAMAEQAPNLYKSQKRAREALVAALSKRQEPSPEIQVPDDVGFGGPDPEDEEVDDKDLDGEMKATALLFMSLPYEEVQQTIQETGFDELYEMKDYFNSLESLRDAVKYGNRDDIKNAALEVLREGSFWETKGSDFQQRLIEVRRRITKEHGRKGRKRVKFIKRTAITAYQYAQLLASI